MALFPQPFNQQQPGFGTSGFGQQAPLVQGQQGPVVDAFASTLGRNPDQGGLDFWRQQLASGVPIEQIRAQMSRSPEAQSRGAINAIPTGISGSEQAFQGGLEGQLQSLDRFGQAGFQALGGAQDQSNQLLGQARGDITGAFNQATQGLQPFQQGGQGAFNVQNALAGGAGVEAQQQALGNLQPVNQFLQDQGQRQIASAVGRRGFSGDAIREAARFGQGLASQSLNDQFGRLAQTSGQGLQAAGQIGQLRGQQGGLLSNLGQFGAGQAFNFGQAGANQLNNLGINRANVIGSTATNVARGRSDFGQNLANALGSGASNVAALQESGGAGLSDILGTSGANAANLANNLGSLSAQDQQQLMTLLTNLSVQQGTQLAGQSSAAQFRTNEGIAGDLAQLASGVGTAIGAF